jgi:hypothetical protein
MQILHTKRRPRYVKAHYKKAKAVRNPNVHAFTRVMHHTLAINATDRHVAETFMLTSLPDYTEFTALFDQYRIKKVEVTFIFDRASADANASVGGSFFPNLITVQDHDDNTPLTNIQDYEQYTTFKVRRMDKPIKITTYPKVATAVWNGAFAGYSELSKATQFLDCNYPSIEAYGLKWMVNGNLEGVSTTNLGYLTTYYKYFLECKDTR